MIQRGFNLLDMTASTTLKAKVREEMIPSDMKSSETGAGFDISVALFHTRQRFFERPDIRQQDNTQGHDGEDGGGDGGSLQAVLRGSEAGGAP